MDEQTISKIVFYAICGGSIVFAVAGFWLTARHKRRTEKKYHEQYKDTRNKMTAIKTPAAGKQDRKAELERQLLKLQGELEDTTAETARARIIKNINKLNEEYATFYQDEPKGEGYGF